MEHAIVIKFEGADFFARKNPKRTFELHLTGVSIDQIKAARNDDELFELYKDNHVLFHVKSAGGVSKLTPVSTCSGIAHDLPPFIDIEINQDFQSDRVPARGVAPALAVPSGQSRELISLRLAG